MQSKAVLRNMKSFCEREGVRMTPPRLHVLEIVANSKKPLTAYEILDLLGTKLDKPKPPTAYRALEFLSKHGFIHRIESLNAFVACGEDHQHHGSQFMICDSCGHVEEVHLCHVPEGLAKQAKSKGFKISHWNVELHGRCKNCR